MTTSKSVTVHELDRRVAAVEDNHNDLIVDMADVKAASEYIRASNDRMDSKMDTLTDYVRGQFTLISTSIDKLTPRVEELEQDKVQIMQGGKWLLTKLGPFALFAVAYKLGLAPMIEWMTHVWTGFNG